MKNKIVGDRFVKPLEEGDADVLIEAIIRDKKTKKIVHHSIRRCESFTKYFMAGLLTMMNRGTYGVTTTGTEAVYFDVTTTTQGRALVYQSLNLFCSTGSGATLNGIVIGTGTTAVTINDFKLEAPIAHGTGSGELQYSAVSFGAPVSSTGTTYFIISRLFTNNSGSQIDVTEAGLYCIIHIASTGAGGNQFKFMTLHDIIDPAFEVSNTQELTLNYLLRTNL